MKSAAKWPGRVEIALLLTGVSLLGAGFAASALRWNYQARQERAFLVAVGVGDLPAPNPVPTTFGGDPLVLGRIEIPRIGVKAIVREGADEATLALAVGHIPGTVHPGEIGNTAYAGHRDTFFRELRDIRLNDEVRLVVPPHSYEYRVVSMWVVAPEEVSVLDSTEAEELTLVTCYPFHYIGHAPNRFIVRAARVQRNSESVRDPGDGVLVEERLLSKF